MIFLSQKKPYIHKKEGRVTGFVTSCVETALYTLLKEK
jgi:hypothetical protein